MKKRLILLAILCFITINSAVAAFAEYPKNCGYGKYPPCPTQSPQDYEKQEKSKQQSKQYPTGGYNGGSQEVKTPSPAIYNGHGSADF